ncbi:MAG: ATP-binding cassette domain-containing protein [Caldimonas sp.]
MNATPFLRATGLSVAGRLDDISFELARGSTLAILGPSGSGKTTLLRLIAGFEALQSGTIEIEGELVSSPGKVIVPPERRSLAFAFQEPALMPHLDAIGNVHLGIREARTARIAAARQALTDVGLPGFEKRRIWEISGGEAQRIQLARTLAFDSRLLLLDEPFASVDRMCRADLLSRIGDRIRRGAGQCIAAIVTHDPADAMELSDVTMVLQAGKIVAYGAFDRIAAGDFGEWPAQFLAAGFAGREIA